MLTQQINLVKTDWRNVLLQSYELHGEEIERILKEHEETYNTDLDVLPPKEHVFKCFDFFDMKECKAIIIGQDPFINKGEAMGLCFSLPAGVKCTPSLRNIFKELKEEYGELRTRADLSDWAQQGVLLLNTALTVRETCSGSHLKAWKNFTWYVVKYIAEHLTDIVFILWGNHAQQYEKLISDKHKVIKGIHPSPLAARSGSFVGNNHFKLANEYLKSKGKDEIVWL